MKPAVINVDLAWGAACDLVLLVQDAAGVPLDLSGAALDFALKAGDASVPLAVDAADAAEGLVRVRVPGQDLGMFPWEGWLQTSPETPRERILRGLMTVTDKVDPRAEGNPSTHRYFVRLSDAVTVSVDSVDLAWWAYAHALKAQESMESLADAWPETVSEAKQDVHAVKEDALAAIRDKQADAVLAVGRAQKTATDKIAGAQADAVSAVQEAEEEAQGTITPLVQRAETAKEAIDQAEGRINTAATNAATADRKKPSGRNEPRTRRRAPGGRFPPDRADHTSERQSDAARPGTPARQRRSPRTGITEFLKWFHLPDIPDGRFPAIPAGQAVPARP